MKSFDYLVDTDELDGVILYYSDNEAITDDPVKTVTNEAFHVSESPMIMLTFSVRIRSA